MSMIGMFVRVGEPELQQYISNSSLFEDFLDSDEFDGHPRVCDIDKTWDVLSYLLTGCALEDIGDAEPPFSWVIFGAHVLDAAMDLGYGPANYVTAEQVQLINKALADITVKNLEAKYDADQINASGIYPNAWGSTEDEMDYIGDNFEALKAFYNTAAVEGQAVICYLS